MPEELRTCLEMGADTTLMVWADLDDDMADGDQLRQAFWTSAEKNGITKEQFDTVVFVFAKDRLENWIEFLLTGSTDESREGVFGKRMAGAWLRLQISLPRDAGDRFTVLCSRHR